jgi:hypothetical protein
MKDCLRSVDSTLNFNGSNKKINAQLLVHDRYVLNLMDSRGSWGPPPSFSLDDEMRLGRSVGRHVLASCQGYDD